MAIGWIPHLSYGDGLPKAMINHSSAAALKARIPGCEMKVLYGAGHACQIEQPWDFDRYMIEFLKEHGLFPSNSTAR